jgi:hypothetical protein
MGRKRMYISGPPRQGVVEHFAPCRGSTARWPLLEQLRSGLLRSNSMSKAPNEDPRQQTDWKNTKQTDQPWKGPVEREQRNEDRIDPEKWHDTSTH